MKIMKKILVVYFSASGETKRVATNLAAELNADIEEIVPIPKYNASDLNWRNPNSRSSLEMAKENCRPEIAKTHFNPSDYDVLMIGFPIWWDIEPKCIDSYLDNFSSAKTLIIPFATSGGSSILNSVKHLKSVYPHFNISKEGLLLNFGIDKEKIKKLIA